MNAQFLGSWDVAPRGHPGDGRVDVLDGDIALGDRWKARSRLPAGTHVPHPGIRQTRAARWETTFDRPAPVRLDGEVVATARRLEVEVEPDALHVVV
jgi:diacylglycerol kinase family enzyme